MAQEKVTPAAPVVDVQAMINDLAQKAKTALAEYMKA